MNLPQSMTIQPEITRALKDGQPVVALESAVITHGLPRPVNIETAREMEAIIRDGGAIPATIALLDGKVHIGLTSAELQKLATLDGTRKISRRDFGYAIAKGLSGGTTVSGTMLAAALAGIRVFATGGIGGVHRGSNFDISADLPELGKTPLVVVCAGAKAILDLPATLEVLETQGVLVAGYQTDDLPAFYSPDSGLPLDARFDSPEQVAVAAQAQWGLGINSGLLVVQPIPSVDGIPSAEMDVAIHQAVEEANRQGISGPSTTPFLLARVKELSGGRSMQANLSLLRNNARLAAQIAAAFSPGGASIA